jgi:gliding motility-associated-like protein
MKILFLRVFLVPLFSLFVSIQLVGQQTTNYLNNWHIGNQVGVDFNSGAAVLAPSAISAYEVSASWSDGNGNNLFYIGADNASTGGASSVIWDATHTLVPNGDISLDFSSTCGLSIAPVPGNCDQYYIFHLKSTGPGWGLHYSTMDMSLPGNGTVPAPLGDIVAGQKDVLVYGGDNLSEKIKIVQKGNTENYWVITRSITTDVFYAFEVTSAGINAVPVTSVISGTTWATVAGSPIFSWLAVNKDRNVIAEANGFTPNVQLFSFDNLTGILNLEEVLLTGTFGTDIPYGLEFSPSGDVLYTNWIQTGGNTLITGWDMTAGFGAVAATRQDYVFSTSGSAEYGGLTRAPDGKIYGSRFGTTEFLEIQNPENLGAAGVVSPGLDPAPNELILGMPNVTYYFHPDHYVDTLAGNDRNICKTDQVEIGAIGYDSVWVNYVWEPAAMLSGAANEATPITVALSSDQQYIVHLITACGDTVNTDTTMVFVSGLDAGADTTVIICDDMLSFDLTEFIGGSPDPGGTFTPALNSGTLEFDPAVDAVGNYVYSHSDVCANFSTITVSYQSCQVCVGNLVPNASFENIVYCPDANGQMDAVQDWDKPFTGSVGTGTSDYYNTCGLNVSTPNTGNGYASFFTYVNFLPNSREYVQTQLTSPLVAGECYEVSMYLAMEPGGGYAHDSIGMYFTNTAPQSPGGTMITAVPQFATTIQIPNSNWVQVSGMFTAVGGEQFLTIGVFSQDANLTITPTGSGAIGTKHLVDDVCVIAIPEDSVYNNLVADQNICDLSQDTLIAPPGFGKYTWLDSTGSVFVINDTLVYTPLGNTYFILNALDTSVCPNELNIDTVYIFDVGFDANVTSSSPICTGDNLTLNATPTGLGNGAYSWVNPNGPMAAQLPNILIVPFPNTAPAGWYYVTVDDGNCTDTDSVLVVVNPTYDITIDTNVCEGSNYNYPDGSSSIINADETNVASLLTVNGCDSIITTNVTMISSPVIAETITDESCPTLCDGVIVIDIAAGTGPYDVEWFDGLGASMGVVNGVVATDSITGLCPDNYSIEVTGSAGGSSVTTVIFTEDFESGVNGWTMNVPTGVNGADNNYFEIDDDESGMPVGQCGAAGMGNSSLHVTSVFFPGGGAAYDAGGLCGILFCPETNVRTESPNISTVGFTGLTLNFAYIGNGDGLNDNASLWYNDGGGWTLLDPSLKSNMCAAQGEWTAYSIALPVSCENIANLQIGFNWTNNDDGVGTDPSFAVNDIEIVSVMTTSGASCTQTGNYVIAAGIDPIITAENATDITNCVAPDGSITITANGTFYELFTSGGASVATNATGSFTGLAAGDYYVEVSLNGCITTSSTFTINNASAPAAPNAGTTTTYCIGDPMVDLVAAAGSGGALNWYSDAGLITNIGTGTTLTPGTTIGTTTYFVTETLAGCESPATTIDITITVCCDLGVTATPTDETCDGFDDGMLDFTITGTGTYDILVNAGLAFDDIVAGNYNLPGQADGVFAIQVVDITDPTCDTTFNVTINPGVVVSITSETTTDITDCVNPDGTFTVTSNGTSFELFTSAGGSVATNATGAFTGLNAGDYYVVASIGACTAQTTTLSINNASAPAAPIAGTDASYCQGDAMIDLTATAGAGGTLNWYDDAGLTNNVGTGATLSPATTLGVTIYYVTETLAGCESAASSVTISINAIPSAPLAGTDATYCAGDPMIDLTATAGAGGTLNWYSDAGLTTNIGTGSTLTPGATIGTTTYYVSETVGVCESVSSQVVITINNNPTITAEVATVVTDCTNPDGTITITSTGTSFELFDVGNNSIATNATGIFTGLSAGDYYVVVSNGICSTTGATLTILDAATPVAPTITGTIDYCQGDVYTALTANGTGGIYNWYDDVALANLIATGGNYTPTVLLPGANVFYVTETLNGCTSPSGQVTVTLNETPTATITNPGVVSICQGDSYDMEITFTGQVPFSLDYSIDGVAQATLNGLMSTTYIMNVTTAGTYLLTGVSDAGTCVGTTDANTVILTVNTAPLAPTLTTASGGATFCEGDTMTLNATGGLGDTIIWYNDSGLTNPVGTGSTFDPGSLQAGTYTFYAQASNGCVGPIADITITVIGVPELELPILINICEGETVTVTPITASQDPIWNNGDSTAEVTFTPTVDTFVVATIQSSCVNLIDTTFIYVYPAPIVDAGADVTVPLGATVDLLVSGVGVGMTYVWAPASYLSCSTCEDPTASVVGTTPFVVTGTDENGCSSSDTIYVIVDGEISIFIPNVFSPNGDGENDIFKVYGPAWESYQMQIYNRWGGLVFDSEDPNMEWDGKHYKNGGDCPQAVFVYKFRGVTIVGQTFEKAGNVMLTR